VSPGGGGERLPFDQITLGQTTSSDLKEPGFDPFENPNIKLLNYLDIT
jgi:hypothetical protein